MAKQRIPRRSETTQFTAEAASTNSGAEGCPCIDAAPVLSTLSRRSCQTSSGEQGVMLTPEPSSCVPVTYGSNTCDQHDLLHSPLCEVLDETKTFCLRSWCFVDLDGCKTLSSERVYLSDYFGSSLDLLFDNSGGVDLYYSYTTCGSTGADWEVYKHVQTKDSKVLGGKAFRSLVADVVPYGFKRGIYGKILNYSSPEYHNDSVPYEGVYIDYINDLIRISNGDIQMVNFTHRSNAADELFPDSQGSAAVQDVADGLVDFAIGSYWITGERLKLTPFTVPLTYDKIVLVIPRPGSQVSPQAQSAKVLEPFEPGLWILSVVVILLSAFLSVWFRDRSKAAKLHRKTLRDPISNKRVKKVYARLILDSILQKGMFFFGAAIEQEEGDSLSNKLLMFGYGFFILIAVSAYVANLAAFLTRPIISNASTIEAVVKQGLTVCAHPATRKEMEIKWPEARFVFDDSGNEFHGVLEDYDAGKCAVMAISTGDSLMDETLMEKFCKRDLVITDSVIIQIPVAFPVKPELVSGLSYWIMQGDKYYGVSVENSKAVYIPQVSCNVMYAGQEEDLGENDFAQISPLNMTLPILTYVACAMTAVLLHVCRKKQVRRASLNTLKSVPRGMAREMSRFEDGSSKIYARNSQRRLSNIVLLENDQPSLVPKNNVSFAFRSSGMRKNVVSFGSEYKLTTRKIDDLHEEYDHVFDADEEIQHVTKDVFVTTRSEIETLTRRIGELVEAELAKKAS